MADKKEAKKVSEVILKNVDMVRGLFARSPPALPRLTRPRAQQTEEVKVIVVAAIEEAFKTKQRASDIAKSIREACEASSEGKFWNVCVGKQYGSDVTHMAKRYLSATFRDQYILVWKSG